MPSVISWLRFFLGIGLAIEVARLWTDGHSSTIGILMVLAYFVLTIISLARRATGR